MTRRDISYGTPTPENDGYQYASDYIQPDGRFNLHKAAERHANPLRTLAKVILEVARMRDRIDDLEKRIAELEGEAE